MRRLSCCCCTGLLLVLVVLKGGSAAETPPPSPPPKPTAVELVEDLRILSLVNALHPTQDQNARLAEVAQSAKDELERLDEELKQRLEKERDRLAEARSRLLRGGTTPATTDAQLASASANIQSTRAARVETLLQNLTAKVQRILTPQQAALIESDLAPSFDQPWRGYARVIGGPSGAGSRNSVRLLADPGKWLQELRDLRTDSAEGDPKTEIEDFGKKMSRGLTPGTTLYDQTVAQAKTFATQVLSLPSNVFAQREAELARLVAKQELNTRNEQRAAQGKPVERFDTYRWFVEEVIVSPRASTDLRDRSDTQ
jgi:hypothetical protein